MMNIDKVIDSFVTGDYFLVVLAILLMIVVVLVISLIKSKDEYNELLNENIKTDYLINNSNDTLFDDFETLMAKDKSDTFDEDKPLIKQISIPEVKTYNDIINEYENSEEENAVISASELEKRTKERLAELGTNDNQIAIQKYEEEQEKKAIISYEQLLKNASNITLSYIEEDKKSVEAPRINKVEIEQKEVVGAEIYLEEEEFLRILKEFRMTL